MTGKNDREQEWHFISQMRETESKEKGLKVWEGMSPRL